MAMSRGPAIRCSPCLELFTISPSPQTESAALVEGSAPVSHAGAALPGAQANVCTTICRVARPNPSQGGLADPALTTQIRTGGPLASTAPPPAYGRRCRKPGQGRE